MSNVADTQTSPSNAGTAKKLIHAAALAAALVPLGSVLAHGATISCFTTAGSGAGCDGTGTYTPTGSGGGDIVSNTWKFFNGSDLIYTFEIKGVPTSTFSLDVSDFVTTQGGLEEAGALPTSRTRRVSRHSMQVCAASSTSSLSRGSHLGPGRLLRDHHMVLECRSVVGASQ